MLQLGKNNVTFVNVILNTDVGRGSLVIFSCQITSSGA